MYNIFASVKASVTARQAAEYYGFQVNRNSMICCPFHSDKHPSMKVDERYYHCRAIPPLFDRKDTKNKYTIFSYPSTDRRLDWLL